VHVRIGLHTGEVIRQGRSLFGSTVILAARVASAAAADEILVSGVVKGLVNPSSAFRFARQRMIRPKGFPTPQAVFSVEYAPPPPPGDAPARS
jgi:class 3 adenylate cyclase